MDIRLPDMEFNSNFLKQDSNCYLGYGIFKFPPKRSHFTIFMASHQYF